MGRHCKKNGGKITLQNVSIALQNYMPAEIQSPSFYMYTSNTPRNSDLCDVEIEEVAVEDGLDAAGDDGDDVVERFSVVPATLITYCMSKK